MNRITFYIHLLVLSLITMLNLSAQSYDGPDFNGDGRADIGEVWSDGGLMSANVYTSNGSSISQQQWSSQQGTYSDTDRWFYADFNGDGNTDIAKLWNDGGQMSCDVYTSNGSGSLTASNWANQSGTFLYSDKWFVGDYNDDGKSDLARVFNDGGSRSIYVYLANGAGNGFNGAALWENKDAAFNSDHVWLTGDFDGDGATDFAVVRNGTTVTIDVHRSNKTNDFVRSSWQINNNRLPKMKWVAADFTGDGRTDIAKLWDDGGDVSIDIHVSSGSAFTTQNWIVREGDFKREYKWFIGDFNGDNRADILRVYEDQDQVSLRSYQSTGSDMTLRTLLTRGTPYRDQNVYNVGDFTGDGKTDLAVTWADTNNRYTDVIVSTNNTSTVSRFTTNPLGSYYSRYNVGHPVWGDDFISHPEIVGAVPSGADLQAIMDAGNDVFLVKNAIYNLSLPLTYKASYQRLETHNAIFLADFAIIRQQLEFGEQDALIYAGGRDYIHLANVVVDGNKYLLGPKPWIDGQNAMIRFGAGDGHWVRRCIFENTRVWSTCQIHQASNARDSLVEHNFVLGAGNGPRGNGRDIGETAHQVGRTGWSDGFSIAARNTVIRYNFIMDCTDVGMVLFGVPGGHSHDNLIFNFSRESLGGINLVDGVSTWNMGDAGYGNGASVFDYRGLVVENNEILATGARIQMGMPISNQGWVCELPEVFDFGVNPETGQAGRISNNRLEGGAMGYGFMLSHLRNLTFQGNTSIATHSGKGNGSGCSWGNNGGNPDPATAFIFDASTITGSNLQGGMTPNTKPISHYLYMNHAPKNADGYAHYAYTDPEAEAIVTASYLEMLGRAPSAAELTNGKNQFLTNTQMIGDQFKRNLMGYTEFISKFGNVGSENLHVFRTARWRDRVEGLDALAIMQTGNYSVSRQLHDDILADLQYQNVGSDHNAMIVDITPNLPSSQVQGEVDTIAITVTNIGTATWQNTAINPEKIAFGSVGNDTTFGNTRYYIPDGVSVASGESYTFNVNIVAPPIPYDAGGPTTTPYPFDFKMIKETVGWFGESISDELGGTHQISVQHALPPPTYGSTFISQNLPASVLSTGIQPGAQFPVEITFRNDGNRDWSHENKYYLGSENLRDNNTWGSNRAFMGDGDIAPPNTNYTFTFIATAPTTLGNHNFQWQMLNSTGGGWFGVTSANLVINVTNGAQNVDFNDASFVSWDWPATVLPNSNFNVLVTMRNDGTTSWTSGNGFALGATLADDDRTDEPNSTISSQHNDSPAAEGHDKLFDDNASTKYLTFNASAWVQHQFGNGNSHVITKYALTSANDAEQRDPLNWTLSGSNNGSTWTTVDTRSGVDFPNRFQRLEFDISGNSTAYEYFRLEMTNNSGTILQLAEWELLTEDDIWSTGTRVAVSDTVAPGAQTTFTIPVTAPAETGDYAFQWKMVDDPGSVFFGESTPTDLIEVGFSGLNGSQYVNQSVPSTVQPGENFVAQVTFVNTGASTWTTGSGYKLSSRNPIDNTTWGLSEVALPNDVAPAASVTFNIPCVAPTAEDSFNFQWQMRHAGGEELFGALTQNSIIVVVPQKPAGLTDRTNEAGIVITSQHNDSPAGLEIAAAYDNNVNTQFNTPNNQSWSQVQFPNDDQYTVVWYTVTSAVDAPAPPPSNILPNPSFENGGASPTDWSINHPNVTSSTELAQDGSRSLKYVGNGATFINPTNQTIAVEANTTYDISVWVHGSGITSGPLVFDTADKPDQASEVQFVINQNNASGGWTEFTGSLNTGSLTTLTLRLFAETNFNGTAYFDNISVKKQGSGSMSAEDMDPLSWTLSGSNDGSAWTAIDSRSNIDFPTRGLTLEFSALANSTAYEYYRFDAANNTGDTLQYAEIELWGDASENSNTPPSWNSTPVVLTDGVEAVNYSGSIASSASDGDGDTLTFSKTSGPAWLNIAPNGSLSGIPQNSNVGLNAFTVSVSDGNSPPVAGSLQINVMSDYEKWKMDIGIPLPCVLDDCNGNDIPDIVEYALDGQMPELEKSGSFIEFKVNRVRSTINYEVEKSGDLINWETLTVVNDGHGAVGTEARVPVNPSDMVNGKVFIRLKIED